jgi:hypothetical protein
MPPAPPPLPEYMPFILFPAFAGIAYTAFSSNVRVKRIVLPIALLLVLAMFMTMLWTFPGQRPWGTSAMLVAVLVLTYRSIKFCPRCGTTSKGRFLIPARFCSKCGQSLGNDS